MSAGTLKQIAVRHESRAPMEELTQAEITVEDGVTGDYRGKLLKKRQVTVLSAEAWALACTEVGEALPWTTRRSNLLVEGVSLQGTVGQLLRVGDAILEINGETTPCQRMEEAQPGLLSALEPDCRGGVLCTVIQSGKTTVGDAVTLEVNLKKS